MTLWFKDAEVVGPPKLTHQKMPWTTKQNLSSQENTKQQGEKAPLGRETGRLDKKAISPWSINVSCLFLILATFLKLDIQLHYKT